MDFSLLLAAGGSNAAIWTFLFYTIAVFVIAGFANRLLKGKDFLGEYFLGSRGLGTWAFALTFAATSASGGTFTGFPAKIYTHGWILALWIASYMIVPICTMGLFGKRINQVARKSNSITIPDVLRDRFESPVFGIVSTLLIVFFLAVNLVAQFKAGSVILQSLVQDVGIYQSGVQWVAQRTADVGFLAGVQPGYLLCLILFGLAVILYTSYGGFHAVVWTDVMQGVVMVAGVAIMLPLAISQVGGMSAGTRAMSPNILLTLSPPTVLPAFQEKLPIVIVDEVGAPGRCFISNSTFPKGVVSQTPFTVQVVEMDDSLHGVANARNRVIETPNFIRLSPETGWSVVSRREVPFGFVTGPGPSRDDVNGFLPFSLAISFFFMWAISGTGQPQYMVRLMAFKDTRTLRHAIVAVTIYSAVIYFPLVIIFCMARVLLPGMENEADKIMPTMAVTLTENAGVPWLAGLLIAAPFAAVMSTVDSFLLVISSSVVRDIYQRNINPAASEKVIKRMSYFTTLVVGTVAMVFAMNPPQYLQDLIVYVGSGLACCFLFPVAAMLYWPRANSPGCLGGMLVGFGAHLAPHLMAKFEGGSFAKPVDLFGLSPLMAGFAASLIATLFLTLLTPPPAEHLVRKYFYKES
ncbi:MAG: hypothetical protein R3C01_02610 [Planctomycetaceae bacterium]